MFFFLFVLYGRHLSQIVILKIFFHGYIVITNPGFWPRQGIKNKDGALEHSGVIQTPKPRDHSDESHATHPRCHEDGKQLSL